MTEGNRRSHHPLPKGIVHWIIRTLEFHSNFSRHRPSLSIFCIKSASAFSLAISSSSDCRCSSSV